jgi:transglutaminase/protease-like cytokinesis protein 3
MINFDTSLTRIEDLEVAQVEFSVPVEIECFAEVEVRGFAIDQDGDVYDAGEVVKKRALCQVSWESGIKTYRVKAVLPGDEGQGILKIYAGKRGLIVSPPPKEILHRADWKLTPRGNRYSIR